jgi:hypothetical protein
MKRLIIGGLIILCLAPLIHGQIRYENGDTLINWASSGLNIRMTKESNSEILLNIPFGEKIIVLEKKNEEETKVRIKISCFIEGKKTPEFDLVGKMIKVKYGKSEGYVFDGFLSNFQPLSNNKNVDDQLEKNNEILKRFDLQKQSYSSQLVYSNGINKFAFSPGSGCQENSYIIPEISLQEGFLFLYHVLRLNSDELNSEKCRWYISDIGNNYIKISGTAGTDFSGSVTYFGNFTIITIGMYN